MIRPIVATACSSLLILAMSLEAAGQTLEATDAAPATASGTKRALLICGLSGDADHHKSFVETITKIHAGLIGKLGFAPTDVEILFGDAPIEADGEVIRASTLATREELEKRAKQVREKLRPEDVLWVLVFGHTYYDGQNSWLNLPGPDLHQADFAKLFGKEPACQQVFFLTTPTSGFYVKSLSAKNRVVITATEADWETNETEFAGELARLLSAPPPVKELDVDLDGQVSLFDLYISLARNLAQSYRDRELLATEHPLLDDNGDGRGTELQIDFLIAELGGRAKAVNPVLPTVSSTADGYLSKSIRLPIGE